MKDVITTNWIDYIEMFICFKVALKDKLRKFLFIIIKQTTQQMI